MRRIKGPRPPNRVVRLKLLALYDGFLSIDPLRMPPKLRREFVAKRDAVLRKDWVECARLGVISWD